MEVIEPDNTEPEMPTVAARPQISLYTYIILGGIAAVFLAQMLFGDVFRGTSNSIIAGDNRSAFAAGFVKPFFTEYHQYWRILTGAAVHGGILHVVMNGYAFFLFGRLIEMLSNRAHL